MPMLKDVLKLEPGDLIRTAPNRIERVYARTDIGGWGTCIIHTDAHDITTPLPCSVQIEN